MKPPKFTINRQFAKQIIAWFLLTVSAVASVTVALMLLLSSCTVIAKQPTYVIKNARELNNGVISYSAYDITPKGGFNMLLFRDTVKFCVGDTVAVARKSQHPNQLPGAGK